MQRGGGRRTIKAQSLLFHFFSTKLKEIKMHQTMIRMKKVNIFKTVLFHSGRAIRARNIRKTFCCGWKNFFFLAVVLMTEISSKYVAALCVNSVQMFIYLFISLWSFSSAIWLGWRELLGIKIKKALKNAVKSSSYLNINIKGTVKRIKRIFLAMFSICITILSSH